MVVGIPIDGKNFVDITTAVYMCSEETKSRRAICVSREFRSEGILPNKSDHCQILLSRHHKSR
jgi:hypothetical protein